MLCCTGQKRKLLRQAAQASKQLEYSARSSSSSSFILKHSCIEHQWRHAPVINGVLVHVLQALFNLGNLHRQSNECKSAVQCYDSVLALNSQHWRSMLNKAVALMGLHEDRAAQLALKQAYTMSGETAVLAQSSNPGIQIAVRDSACYNSGVQCVQVQPKALVVVCALAHCVQCCTAI